jgi:hypothetical protein
MFQDEIDGGFWVFGGGGEVPHAFLDNDGDVSVHRFAPLFGHTSLNFEDCAQASADVQDGHAGFGLRLG